MVYIVLLICYFWMGKIFYEFICNSLQLFIWIIDRAAINWFEWMQIIYFLIATLLIFYIFIWIAFPNSKAIVISTTMLNTTAMVVMQWWRRFAGMWWKPPFFSDKILFRDVMAVNGSYIFITFINIWWNFNLCLQTDHWLYWFSYFRTWICMKMDKKYVGQLIIWK